MGHRQLTDSK